MNGLNVHPLAFNDLIRSFISIDLKNTNILIRESLTNVLFQEFSVDKNNGSDYACQPKREKDIPMEGVSTDSSSENETL